MQQYFGKSLKALGLALLLSWGLGGINFLSAQNQIPTDQGPLIKTTFQEYFDHLRAGRFEEMIEYLYEPVFGSLIAKEAMLSTLREKAEEEPKRIWMDSSQIISVSEIISKKNTDYALMKYFVYLRANVVLPPEDSTDSQEEYSDFMVSMFEGFYGKENVHYDPQTLYASIQSENKLICIREEGREDWKFVEWKPGSDKFLKKFIPSSVMNAWNE